MIAYRFLASGTLEPLSDFAWPEPSAALPGAWISARDEPFAHGQSGVQVCRAADLAHWLHEELWIVETDGAPQEGIDSLLVGRARLVRRIGAWQQGGALRFALACAAHAAELVDRVPADRLATARDYIADAIASAQAGYIGVSAHAAALAAMLAQSELDPETSQERAYRAERSWQSEWIAQHIISP